MYSVFNEPFHIQSMKVKFADLLREYQEIKNKKAYHKVAYCYELDSIVDKMARYFDECAKVGEEAMVFIQDNGLACPDKLPPIIVSRINDIIAAFAEENPNLTAEDRSAIVGVLFSEGGELHGLFNDDQTINQEWLDKYVADPNHAPDYHYDIPLTDEMAQDLETINQRDDLTSDQKTDAFSALFYDGGKYEGYIQKDGTVDASKIIQR